MPPKFWPMLQLFIGGVNLEIQFSYINFIFFVLKLGGRKIKLLPGKIFVLPCLLQHYSQ